LPYPLPQRLGRWQRRRRQRRRLGLTSSIGFLYALYWCLPRFVDVLRRLFQCFCRVKATKHLQNYE
jgi:hypothetical protein